MNDLRFAFRQLVASPGFTVVAIVTLALGIGANTSMFTLLNTFLLRPPPFPEPERLFQLDRTSPQQQNGAHVAANFYDIESASAEFAQVAAFRYWGFTVSESGKPAEIYTSHRISPAYFDVLGVKPAMGRLFRPEEDAPGQNHVVVISHRFWQSRFDGDPNIIGRVVRLDSEPTEIVGVLPASAESLTVYGDIRMYRPLGFTTEERAGRLDSSLRVIGRYRPGVSPAQAQAQFEGIAARLVSEHPTENGDLGLRTVSLESTSLGANGKNLTFLLLGLSGFVLLIACANLANLLLARAVARSREFAIRAALGASRGQLIRPLVSECLLLASVGGTLGILVAIWTADWIMHRLNGNGAVAPITLDWRVLGFALAAALITGLLFGVAPALLVSRVRVNDALKSGTRGSTHDRAHQRVRQALIVAQFALALVLLSGAAVFVRGIDRMIKRQAGWNPTALVTGKIGVPATLSADSDRCLQFYQQIQQRLAALPGVESATVDIDLPLYGFSGARGYVVEGREPPQPGHEPTAFTNAISPEYFATVGTKILRGRAITAADKRESPPVYVINETMARTLFPDGDAIGHRLGMAGQATPGWGEIVGVVEDVRFMFIGAQATAFQTYKPLSQETWGYVSVTVRAANAGIAAGLVEPFRKVIAELNPDLPVSELQPVPVLVERSVDDIKVINQLLSAFAVLGLFLAAIGLYGVIARTVLQRTSEIGIRMALGAQLRDVVRLILGGGVRLALAGMILGLIGAGGLIFVLARVMPGITNGSGTAVAEAAVLLVLVALVACWLPARRAAKVDPIVALRAE